RAVPTVVRPLIDVAFVVEALKDLLDCFDVPRLRRADEVVVSDVQSLPQLLERGDDLVDVLLGALARFLGGALHLLSVIIGTCEKEDVFAGCAPPASHGVAKDRGVGMADVQPVAGIVDRGRNVVFGPFHRQPTSLSSSAKRKTPARLRGEGLAVPPLFAARLAARAS